jgi:hypothetical protein
MMSFSELTAKQPGDPIPLYMKYKFQHRYASFSRLLTNS